MTNTKVHETHTRHTEEYREYREHAGSTQGTPQADSWYIKRIQEHTGNIPLALSRHARRTQ
jgi:hypothetical protein